MQNLSKIVGVFSVVLWLGSINAASADTYVFDTKGMHASIEFRIKHLGISWLTGRFDKFNGTFEFDENNPNASQTEVTIDTASVNTNHNARDRHLRAESLLYVSKYPTATFKSTSVRKTGEESGIITGNLTLRGVTKRIQIKTRRIGKGNDPWGGYREGYTGTTTLRLADFGIPMNLGPDSTSVQLTLNVEGIRQ